MFGGASPLRLRLTPPGQPLCRARHGESRNPDHSRSGAAPRRARRSNRRRETRRFMDQMLPTMYDAPGIGLAAIQVGEPRRIITIDVARDEQPKEPAFPGQPGDRLAARRTSARTTRRGASPSPTITPRSSGRRRCASAISTMTASRRSAKWTACSPPAPARGRPSQRRPLHRLSLQAQARPGGEKIHQGGAREGTAAPAPDLRSRR